MGDVSGVVGGDVGVFVRKRSEGGQLLQQPLGLVYVDFLPLQELLQRFLKGGEGRAGGEGMLFRFYR